MQMQIAPEHTVVAQAQGGQTRHVPQVVGKYKINSKNKCDKIFLFSIGIAYQIKQFVHFFLQHIKFLFHCLLHLLNPIINNFPDMISVNSGILFFFSPFICALVQTPQLDVRMAFVIHI